MRHIEGGLFLCLVAVAGCGSAGTAEKILNDVDSARASVSHDRNQLAVDLLHDKFVYATMAAERQAKLNLLAKSKDGSIPVELAFSELEGFSKEVKLDANIRAVNRSLVEMLNIAEERANGLELGLRVQIEAAKGIFGRIFEMIETWQAKQKAAKVVTNPSTTQPSAKGVVDLESLK